mgnify:CR=1 FL=1
MTASCEPLCSLHVLLTDNVMLGLEMMGLPVTERDRQDMMNLWRYLGYLQVTHAAMLDDGPVLIHNAQH